MGMPAFIAQEATRVMAEGGLVFVCTRHPREVLDALAAQIDPKDITRTCRANGDESIDYTSGGRAIIQRYGSSGRGVTADLVVAQLPMAQQDMEDLVPCIAGTSNGQMVGYY